MKLRMTGWLAGAILTIAALSSSAQTIHSDPTRYLPLFQITKNSGGDTWTVALKTTCQVAAGEPAVPLSIHIEGPNTAVINKDCGTSTQCVLDGVTPNPRTTFTCSVGGEVVSDEVQTINASLIVDYDGQVEMRGKGTGTAVDSGGGDADVPSIIKLVKDDRGGLSGESSFTLNKGVLTITGMDGKENVTLTGPNDSQTSLTVSIDGATYDKLLGWRVTAPGAHAVTLQTKTKKLPAGIYTGAINATVAIP